MTMMTVVGLRAETMIIMIVRVAGPEEAAADMHGVQMPSNHSGNRMGLISRMTAIIAFGAHTFKIELNSV